MLLLLPNKARKKTQHSFQSSLERYIAVVSIDLLLHNETFPKKCNVLRAKNAVLFLNQPWKRRFLLSFLSQHRVTEHKVWSESKHFLLYLIRHVYNFSMEDAGIVYSTFSVLIHSLLAASSARSVFLCVRKLVFVVVALRCFCVGVFCFWCIIRIGLLLGVL